VSTKFLFSSLRYHFMSSRKVNYLISHSLANLSNVSDAVVENTVQQEQVLKSQRL
jgi:hypothetical protein